MNNLADAPIEARDDIVSSDMTGVCRAPDPVRTWKHKLRNAWNLAKGCACAGMVSQGSVHSLCIAFAGISGASSSSVSRIMSSLFNGQGIIGLTAAETFQYIAAPALSIPLSYGIDRVRNSQYSFTKAGIALGFSAVVAGGIAYAFPHQHNTDMAVAWFDSQPKERQDNIRAFAAKTHQTVNEVALGLCSSNPNIKAEMDRLQRPAYQRILTHFGIDSSVTSF